MALTEVTSLIGAGSSLIGGIGGLFTSASKQRKQQEKLNRQVAELNYQYGEMSKENDYERSQRFYDYQREQESPAARLQEYEEAGLSKSALAASMGGGAGGGVGLSGGGMETGAEAGQAETTGDRISTAYQGISMGLQAIRMGEEIESLRTDRKNKEQQIKESQAREGLISEQAATESATREALVKKIQEEGVGQSLINDLTAFMQGKQSNVKEDSYAAMSAMGDITRTWSEINKNKSEEQKNVIEAVFTKRKTEGLFLEMEIAMMHARAAETQAAAALSNAETNKRNEEYNKWNAMANYFNAQTNRLSHETADEVNRYNATTQRLKYNWDKGKLNNWKVFKSAAEDITGGVMEIITGQKGWDQDYNTEGPNNKRKKQW